MRSPKQLDEFTSEDIEQVLKYRELFKIDRKILDLKEVHLWVVEVGSKYSMKAFDKAHADYPVK